MPTIVNFNNRQIIEPGAYSQIKSGIPVPAVLGTYANVMVIDTGIGKDYGWGSGVNGELQNGAGSIYSFTSLEDMKRAVKGGIVYDLMDYLWSPTRNGNGPRTVYYARAATTTAAKFTMALSSSIDLVIKAKTEGTAGNGTLQTNNSIPTLVKGYGMKIKAGIIDPTAFILEFYEGQYRGADESGSDYDVSKDTVSNYIITRSSEFKTSNQLLAWLYSDYNFNQYFDYKDSDPFTDDVIANTILTTYSGIQVLAGGTTEYKSTDIDDLLASMEDLDNSLFLCLDSGITPFPALDSATKLAGANKGALATENDKILSYVLQNSTYTEKILFVGAGSNNNEFTRPSSSDGSLQIAKYYNSAQVVAVHSGIKIPGVLSGSGVAFKYKSSLYHAALVCGRTAGLEPQVPVTYKDLRISGLQHELKKSERELALLSGVLHSRNQPNLGWIVNQGINTLQQNANLITAEGKSPEIQIMRIIHQINKELIINGTVRFVGGNLNTASAEEVKSFVEGYLTTRTATRLADNLIITFNSVKVVLEQDYWKVSYCFVPNSPINRVFFTGFILDPKIEI